MGAKRHSGGSVGSRLSTSAALAALAGEGLSPDDLAELDQLESEHVALVIEGPSLVRAAGAGGSQRASERALQPPARLRRACMVAYALPL